MEENDIRSESTDDLSEGPVYPGQTAAQKASSDRMKQWWADKRAGKFDVKQSKKSQVIVIILVAVGIIGILAYIFRDKLKDLWLKTVKANVPL